jgi:hypothetical protein
MLIDMIYEQRDLDFVFVWLQWPEHCTECTDMYVFAQLVHYRLVQLHKRCFVVCT